MSALAANATAGRPRSTLFRIAHRIAARMSPAVAASFLRSVETLASRINEAELLSAVASGNPDLIDSVISGTDLESIMIQGELERLLRRTAQASGTANAEALTRAIGLQSDFATFHPNVVLFAREQAGALIVNVGEDVREGVRIVLALGQQQGLTVEQQARAIREIVGLPPNWANAPLNLADELRNGTFTATRRLSAIDKSRIRSRLARGTVDEAFIAEMQSRYAASLLNRRALNIARTETIRSSHAGQKESWRQSMQQGVLPASARQRWVVTPDDRLEHWMVPGMNEGGRAIDEMFETPEGPVPYPPSRTNCRCGIGLSFPGYEGVL